MSMHEPGTRYGTLKTVLALIAALALAGCGGGSGGGSGGGNGDIAPDDSTDIAASQLEGTWGGTLESADSGAPQFQRIEVEFDSNGDILSVVVDTTDLNVTGSFVTKPSASGQLLQYTLDGDDMLLYADANAEHAGMLFDDGTLAVLEKGSTSGGFDVGDPAGGSWSGRAVFVESGLVENGFDSVSASYIDNTGPSGEVNSTDVTFTNDTSSCENAEHDLPAAGFDSSYGVFDTAEVTGGSGVDCPGGDTPPADVYLSYDARFMLAYFGCEAANPVDECSLAILSRD